MGKRKVKLLTEEEFNKDSLLPEMFDSYQDYCNYMTKQSLEKIDGVYYND